MTFKAIFSAACVLSTLVVSTQIGHSQQLDTDPEIRKYGTGRIEAAAPKPTKNDVYLSTLGGDILQLNIKTGALSNVVSTLTTLTDIAMCPDGRLYAISFYDLFAVDPKRERVTRIGAHGVTGLNALVCNRENVLLGHSNASSTLYRIDRRTAAGTAIGATGSFYSSGDLEFIGNRLYLSTTDKRLARLDPATGRVLGSSPLGSPSVFGLASIGKRMYGYIGEKVYEINLKTGKRTRIYKLGSAVGTVSGASAAIVK